MSEVHVLLLAAGASSRMGQPKPLLPWGSRNLLENRVQTLKQLGFPITVVLGSAKEEICRQSDLSEVQVVENEQWNSGMASSIAMGVSTILKSHSDCEGILIALVDQPLIGSNHFRSMVEAFKANPGVIIVSQDHDGHWSVPVLFDRNYFSELMALSGDRGAMPIVRKNADRVKSVQSGDSLRDMDTPEEYKELLSSTMV